MKSRKKALLISLGAVAIAIIMMLVSRTGVQRDEKRVLDLDITQPHGDYSVWLNTYPEGAEVSSMDSLLGVTPLAISELASGEYKLRISKAGFVDIDTVISFETGDAVTITPVILNRLLRIDSEPQSARVTVNGRKLDDRTPVNLEWPAVDTFTIELKHDGVESAWLSAVDAATGSQNVPLGQIWDIYEDPEHGARLLKGYFQKSVLVNSTPSGVSVSIAETDSLIGMTGELLLLPCGENEYRLSKVGFLDTAMTWDIGIEQPSSIDFTLNRELHVSAYALGDAQRSDINADIVKADRGIRVEFLDAVTPSVIILPGAEQRLYVRAEGFADTFAVISADQKLAEIGMRAVPDSTELVEEPAVRAEVNNEGKIVVRVLDKKTKLPIPGVDVIAEIKSEDRLVLLGATDSSGIFTQVMKPGKYDFRFTARGYKKSEKGHRLKAGEVKRFDISLKRD